MLSSDPDPSPFIDLWRSWFRKELLPDQLALRISPGCSRVYYRDLIPNAENITQATVVGVRDDLQTVQGLSIDLVAAQIEQQVLSNLIATSETLKKLAAAPNPKDDPSHTSLLEKRQEELAAWLVREGYPAIDAQTDLTALLTAGKARVDTLEKKLGAAEKAFAQKRAEPGIIVARWRLSDKSETEVNSTVGSYEAQRLEGGSGFVVLGAPRVVTLAAGDDLVFRACTIKDANCGRQDPSTVVPPRTGIDSVFQATRLYVTTYQLLARHVAWTDSRSIRRLQTLALKLDKIAEMFAGQPKVLETIKLLQLSVIRTTGSALDAENIGSLSAGNLRMSPFSFATDDLLEKSISAVLKTNESYLVISSMRSTLDGHVLRQSGSDTMLPSKQPCNSLPADLPAVNSIAGVPLSIVTATSATDSRN
jgi:hypothetical protein